jgi:hypothetical protein
MNLSETPKKEIEWQVQTRAYNFEVPFGLKRLDSGDLFIDRLEGDVSFNVTYRPDQYPGWIDWIDFAECATVTQCFDLCPLTNFKPQYRPKMRFPTPSDAPCNATISTPARNLYEVQVMLNIIGYCRVKSLRVHAYDIQESSVGECRTVFPACTPLDVCDINPLTYTSE